MGKLFAALSMSLDGYSAGPSDGREHPMGEGGERLHRWMFPAGDVSRSIVEERFGGLGAVIIGRRMFDNGDAAAGVKIEQLAARCEMPAERCLRHLAHRRVATR